MNKGRSQIIGTLLLVIVLFLHFRFFSHTNKKESVAIQEKQKLVAASKLLLFVQKKLDNTLLSSDNIVLENEDMRVLLSPQGARVVGVQLKKYTTFDQKPLHLLTALNSNMKIELTTKEGAKVDLSALLFSSEINQDKCGTTITLTHMFDQESNQWIRIQFYLSSKGYIVTCHMTTSDNLAVNKAYELSWIQHLANQDNHIEITRRNTLVQYQDHKQYMRSLRDKKDQPVHTKLDKPASWVSIKTNYFLQGITSSDSFQGTELLVQPPAKGENHIVKSVGIKIKTIGSLQFFFGPNDYYTLKGFAKNFENNHYLGPRIFRPINTYIILPIAGYLHQYIANYIWVLLILILIFALLQFYFNYQGHVNSIKMHALKPMLAAINASNKEKSSKDLETMQLYRKAGANPLKQLLSIFIQIPIFICMINFTRYKIDFRQLSFLWIPDISTYDDLLSLPFSIPLIGNFISLMGLIGTFLPIVVENLKKKPPEQTGTQNRLLTYGLPLMLMFVFNTYPVSWWIYRIFSSLLDLCQQLIIRLIVNEEAITQATLSKMANNDAINPKRSRAQTRLQKKIEKKKQ
ncbi:MAG: YidC/Oxa1 family insertase periplasmic-domain containing protein [Bacteroidota bacterium]